MYKIEIKSSAEKSLSKIPYDSHKKVKEKIDELAHNPLPPGCKKLKTPEKDQYRVRAGKYRVIYEVIEDEVLVLIVKVGHRKDIYKNL